MKCPHCDSEESKVIDSRPQMMGEIPVVYRRRRCQDCSETFTTYEITEQDLEFTEDA